MDQDDGISDEVPQQQVTPPAEAEAEAVIPGSIDSLDKQQTQGNMADIEQEQSSTDGMSPMSVTAEVKEGEQRLSPAAMPTTVATPPSSSITNYEFSNVRVRVNDAIIHPSLQH